MKNNRQLKTLKQKLYSTDIFPIEEKEKLTDSRSLSGPPKLDSKYTINQVFNLLDTLNNIPL